MFCKLPEVYFRYTICLVQGLSFLKKSITRCTLFVVHAWHLKSQQSTQKNGPPEFLILSVLKLLSCGLVVFMNMSTYILIEGRNCKTFLKESYPIALDNCDIFIKNMLNMEFKMMLIVLIEFAYIRHS